MWFDCDYCYRCMKHSFIWFGQVLCLLHIVFFFVQSRAAKELCLPVIVTEQYPKALGPTVPEVHEVLPEENSIIVAKTDFSMLVPEVDQKLGELHHVRNIVLVGIETHVCVFQTTLDLIGTRVHTYVDAI